MKIKNLHSPRSKLFNFNNLSTSKIKSDIFVTNKNSEQTSMGVIKKQKSTTPISINQFKRHDNNQASNMKQNSFVRNDKSFFI